MLHWEVYEGVCMKIDFTRVFAAYAQSQTCRCTSGQNKVSSPLRKSVCILAYKLLQKILY